MSIPLLVLSLASCNNETEPADVTDYSMAEHWLKLPSSTEKPVDVFYLYPTVWKPDSITNPLYCKIDDASMLKGSAIKYTIQATAFETVGNVYAPYFRQANAFTTLTSTEEQRWEIIKNIPARDAIAAFDFFIKNYNNGRPFIIVGHSQGANVLLFLLSDYMKAHPKVYARMIASYVIGYPVTAEFLAENKHLKFAEGPDDTGVIISYNTQSPNVLPGKNIVVSDNVGLVINPINWKRDETPASATESLGSNWYDANRNIIKVMNFADARIDLSQGVLICSTVNEADAFKYSSNMGLGVYHSFDIPFYYYNLRENAEKRAKVFLEKSL